mmetsp:Transcript_44124/g.82538  ORF Transcript_44124/g.82538 Transcript_44124/m.82538 type:complete len:292 (-) Transcript_44124:103-978(-)
MPEGNIPPEKFVYNGAEEVLYRNEMHNVRQDPARIPRWRRKVSASSSLPAVNFSDDGSEAACSENSEQDLPEILEEEPSSQGPDVQPEVSLKALPAPSPAGGSPFRHMLGFLHKDPAQVEAEREAALRRKVGQMLRQVYRRSVEASGASFRGPDPPWPPKEKKLPQIKKAPPLLQQLFALPKLAKTQSSVQKERLPKYPVNLERQATVHTMHAFGRGGQGGPYTLRQVYEEVEADINHRRPVDVRAPLGCLGPELLGPGTTRQRRRLPFSHPQMLTDAKRSKSAGTLVRAS